MNENINIGGRRGAAIWSVESMINKCKPIEEIKGELFQRGYSLSEIDSIYQQALNDYNKKGGLRPPGSKYYKKNGNGNNAKQETTIGNIPEPVNAPRGRAMTGEGNWIPVPADKLKLLISKDWFEDLLKSLNSTSKADAEELEKLRTFYKRFAGFENLLDREIDAIRRAHGI